MSRTFDAEEALDVMAEVTKMNDEASRLTVYAVLCPEHGGTATGTAMEAIEISQRANAQEAGAPVTCDYYPVAIALSPSVVARMFAEPPEGS